MPKKSSTASSSAQSMHNHIDPLLYTALFKRKFVKVFSTSNNNSWGGGDANLSRQRSPSPTATRLRDSASCSLALNGGGDKEWGGGRKSPRSISPTIMTTPHTVHVSLSTMSLRKSPCLKDCLACEVENDKVRVKWVFSGKISSYIFSVLKKALSICWV